VQCTKQDGLPSSPTAIGSAQLGTIKSNFGILLPGHL
jgi:hypothetical protein